MKTTTTIKATTTITALNIKTVTSMPHLHKVIPQPFLSVQSISEESYFQALRKKDTKKCKVHIEVHFACTEKDAKQSRSIYT